MPSQVSLPGIDPGSSLTLPIAAASVATPQLTSGPALTLPQKVVNKLYIENSGGNGHVEAVKFQIDKDQKEALKNNYQITPIKIDALKCCGEKFGKSNAEGWNEAKKAGNIGKQEKLVRMQWLADIIYFLPVFFKTLCTIVKNDVHEIFNAQILGIGATLLAARVANRFFKKFRNNPVKVVTQMTDLAHKDSSHFFTSIRKLSAADRKIFTLFVPNLPLLIEERNPKTRLPKKELKMLQTGKTLTEKEFQKLKARNLLTEEELTQVKNGTALSEETIDRLKNGRLLTEQEFWKKHTGLDMSQISKDELPVRQAFKDWNQKHPINDRPEDGFSVNVSSDREIDNLKEVLGLKDLTVIMDEKDKRCVKVPYTDREKDVIILESVGSQVPRQAILDDIKTALAKASTNPETNYSLFVTCGKDMPGGLYGEVVALLKKQRADGNFPTNLKIIPMTYQDDTELAPLLCCSNYVNQGAGGLTSFESFECLYNNLSQAALLENGKVMVRSVAKKKEKETTPLTQEQLLKLGFSVWEKGNARTLAQFLKARFSDADSFGEHVFKKRNNPAVDQTQVQVNPKKDSGASEIHAPRRKTLEIGPLSIRSPVLPRPLSAIQVN